MPQLSLSVKRCGLPRLDMYWVVHVYLASSPFSSPPHARPPHLLSAALRTQRSLQSCCLSTMLTLMPVTLRAGPHCTQPVLPATSR